MNAVHWIIPCIAGLWMVTGALIMDASANLKSKFYFNVIPFFIGLASLYAAGKAGGILPWPPRR